MTRKQMVVYTVDRAGRAVGMDNDEADIKQVTDIDEPEFLRWLSMVEPEDAAIAAFSARDLGLLSDKPFGKYTRGWTRGWLQ
jgi:hypothetical protein